MKKLYLIDGHALIFRSYYAFLRRPMINSKGVDTSILFGFIKTLTDLIIREKPTHLAVAFDPPAKTFRHELYPEYKANRSETPELIKSALEPLTELVQSMSIPVVMKPGFEADDVIGTLAKQAEKDGYTVYMLTPDKDYGQLVSENIFQCKPGKNGGDNILLGKDDICSEYGIKDPAQVIDILTIWGDASDNVPGVRGVGEVGSKKLIQKYGSVENIYKNLSELPEKQQLAFREAEAHIALSKTLVTIDTNVDVACNDRELTLGTPHFVELKKLFSHYEFGSLIRQIPQLEEIFETDEKMSNIVTSVEKSSKANSPLFRVASASEVIEAAQTEGKIGIRMSSRSIYISSRELVASESRERMQSFASVMENESVAKCGYDLKPAVSEFAAAGIEIKGFLADIELMHYLLMPERSHKIEILAQTYLGMNIESQKEMVQADLFSAQPDNTNEAEDEKLSAECSVLIPLAVKLEEELKSENNFPLYENLEMPLLRVLADMERTGIKLDTAMLGSYGKKLALELEEIEKSVREMAEEPNLNVSSPKQLSVVLYDKLGLGPEVKKGSGANKSTDEETLMEIYDSHPIVAAILEFRNLKKLLSTYIEPLPLLVSKESGKIHTTYNQALTATGRLSSIKPNLQNIPVRTGRGREIRKAFIPSHPGGVILSADYSQIELRLMAHMSGDNDFIEAFRQGKDIHSATASKIFGVPEEELTKEQRSRAKTANFGIIYGISAFGLSQRLNIPRADAKKLIEDYFRSYPGVRLYIDSMIEKAKTDGYVSTLYGRKRYLPDINSKNQVVRGLAERNAVNAPIQGSAADIIKVAMIRIAERLKEEKIKSKMVLQVHDELVFDVIPEEIEILPGIVRSVMESVIELSVPLTVECEYGGNWLEAH
ncbi:MAG: DNA polymerase I [Bacteroidetes bacterium HGW-Bacteroidetes-10]|nr:MAG: DNA polymerase I [Bacteroidetes bacterium HGW-Bacteroidetes-10]